MYTHTGTKGTYTMVSAGLGYTRRNNDDGPARVVHRLPVRLRSRTIRYTCSVVKLDARAALWMFITTLASPRPLDRESP